jgi:NAD(P)H-hydrate epimerase
MAGMRVLLAEEMTAIEWNAEFLGVSRLLMMENAGRAVAHEILKRHKRQPTVAIFAGLGGNGGDGFVAARHLAPRSRVVHLIVLGDPERIQNAPAAENWEIVNRLRHSINISIVRDSSELPIVEADVVVDALLGTGAKSTPRKPLLLALQQMNQMSGYKVAIDIPTGIHPNTGAQTTEHAFRPDLTVTFHLPKFGVVKNKPAIGKLVVADIGIPPEAELYIGPGDVIQAISPRSPFAKKGDFGRLLVIGGSNEFIGAPILASMGALRSGVDLVYLAAPPPVITAAASLCPDLIPITLSNETLTNADLPIIEEVIPRVDALLIGPGLGEHHETLDTIGKVHSLAKKHGRPMVLDADALKVVTRLMKIKANTILTPHAGEFRRIAGFEITKSLLQRAQQVRDLAKKLKCIILLKGPVDIVTSRLDTRLNWTGHPVMSVGGTGDVLAGLVAGFRAQRIDPYLSACVGAFVNGAAGLLAFQEKGAGLIARDLIAYIPRIISNPMASPIAYNRTIPLEE